MEIPEQYVCLVCGYNMIGPHPERCPFCGATSEHFITAAECSARFRVESTPVTDGVTCLRSIPELGLEHSAYRVEAGKRSFWIDCPSSFNPGLPPPNSILFTHHHFLGASNLYREAFGAKVYIHRLDSTHEISRPFTFDTLFEDDFKAGTLEAFHIDGHTPGFTFYIFKDVLFVCDYVFMKDGEMRFNPFGPADRTRAGGERMRGIVNGRGLKMVCGFNYFMGFDEWLGMFNRLMDQTAGGA